MYPTSLMDIAGLWVGLALMLMIYSYPLWKENKAYRLAEYTFVSSSMAITLIAAIQKTYQQGVQPMMAGNYSYAIPLLLGVCMYAIFFPKFRWISRYPLAILVGAALGLGMRSVPIPSILNQVGTTITPPAAGDALTMLNFAFVAVGLVCSIAYFFLTYEHKGVIGPPARLGRLFIMLGLGAYFGNTVMNRFAMLTERAQYLLQVLKILPM